MFTYKAAVIVIRKFKTKKLVKVFIGSFPINLCTENSFFLTQIDNT